jgi:hypothetical protein
MRSQDTKDAIILYNTKPVLAEITTNGDVNKIIREEPDFLKGFTLKIQDYGQFLAQQDAGKSSKETLGITSQTNSKPQVFNDFLNIPFDDDYATLTDNAIKKLDETIKFLKENKIKKVILRTLSVNKNDIINTNRLNSIKTYFKIRGASLDVIFENLTGLVDVDEVRISVIQEL